MKIESARKTIDYVLEVVASWRRQCRTCPQTFIPTHPRNVICLDCQLENRSGEGDEA